MKYKYLIKLKDFITYDYLWRCLKVVFYTFFLEAYYLLYFDKANMYAPFINNNLQVYKILLNIELILSFFFLFLAIGGIFKYKYLEIKHHKVWFWIFILFIGLWFTTVWYKFGILCILGDNTGLLYRSPLQNLVTVYLFGIKFHYEPGMYFVHQTWLISGDLGPMHIVDTYGYVDNFKFYNYVCDHKNHLWCNSDPQKYLPYIRTLTKFTESFKIITYFGEDAVLDKNFFYYWTL